MPNRKDGLENARTGYGPAVTDEPEVISSVEPEMHDKLTKRPTRREVYNETRIGKRTVRVSTAED